MPYFNNARLTARFIPGQNAAMVHPVHSAPIAIIRRLPLCMWLRVRVSGPEVC
jgi:hypothetical protein